MKSIFFALILSHSLSSSFLHASDRTLKEVMKEMSPELKTLIKATVFDESIRLTAENLKKLSLEATTLTPATLPLSDQIDFEGMLLNVALKLNQIEAAILLKDSIKVTGLIKEIVDLKVLGHGRFDP